MTSRSLFAHALPLSLAIAACGGNGATASSGSGGSTAGTSAHGTGSTTTTGATVASSSSGSAGGSGPVCPGPGYKGGEKMQQVDALDTSVLDLNGAPVPGLAVQVCGIDLCLTGTTGPSGLAHVAVNKSLLQPLFKYGDARTYVRFGIPVTTTAPMYPKVVTAKLPDAGVAFASGKSVTSGDLTITVPAGGVAAVDTLIYASDDDQKFRSVTVPVAKVAAALDASLGLELVFGASPIETIFCPAAAVSVPNSLMWPAGTAVEFYIFGLDAGEEWAPYGKWQKVSDGKVSGDGKTVATLPTGGLPILTIVGIRKKP